MVGHDDLGRHLLHAREEAVTQLKPVTATQECGSSSFKAIYFPKEAKNMKCYIEKIPTNSKMFQNKL